MTHEYTKYPSIKEQVGGLINMREEALAAHEFTRQRMLQRITSNFELFKLGQKVWLEARNLKTIYNKKIMPKMWRTIQNHKSLITTHLFSWSTSGVVHSQCVSRIITHSIHRRRSSRTELYKTTCRIDRTRRRRMGSQMYHWTLKMRMWPSIPRVVERISDN